MPYKRRFAIPAILATPEIRNIANICPPWSRGPGRALVFYHLVGDPSASPPVTAWPSYALSPCRSKYPGGEVRLWRTRGQRPLERPYLATGGSAFSLPRRRGRAHFWVCCRKPASAGGVARGSCGPFLWTVSAVCWPGSAAAVMLVIWRSTASKWGESAAAPTGLEPQPHMPATSPASLPLPLS